MPWEVCMSLHSRLKVQESSGNPCWDRSRSSQYQREMPLSLALQAAAWDHLEVHRYVLMPEHIAWVDCTGHHNHQLRST